MTILQLKNFLVVAETLNFRKAAEQILIAQPALSRQIQQLEENIGAQLFDRSKKNIMITEAGTYFKNEINRILHQLDESISYAKKIEAGQAGEILIGHASSAMQIVLPRLLKNLQENEPYVKAILTENSNKDILDKLLHHEIDIGFVPNANLSKNYKSKTIYKENFALIVSQNHRLTKKNFSSLADCANENWILPPLNQSQGYNEMVYTICQKHGFIPNIVHESVNGLSVLRLVESGIGITMMSKSILSGLNLNIRHFELKDLPEKVEMKMVWLAEREKELRKTVDLFTKYIFI
jgi:LysR family transcriptional regulator, benzoate and cis,cis-muconate-responsive activator of ben and cat genes